VVREHGYRVVIDRETAAYSSGPESIDRKQMATLPLDFVVVLGGDGTLLYVAGGGAGRHSGARVNLGSGLSDKYRCRSFQALDDVDQKRATVESRSLVHCGTVARDGKSIGYSALNDVIVNKSAPAPSTRTIYSSTRHSSQPTRLMV
jgi:NAD kinase